MVITRQWLDYSREADSYVKVEGYDDADGNPDSATLKIADCTKSINLHFLRNQVSRRKLKILQEALDKLEDYMDYEEDQ